MAHHARRAELRAVHAARPPARSARAALPRVRHAREQRRARQHAADRSRSCACGASRPRCSAIASYAELSLREQDGAERRRGRDDCSRSCAARRSPPRSATSRSCARSRATAGAPEAAELRHWDVAFWAERLREQRYAYTDEELRPYFPLPRVLDGLFALVRRLFGVRDPRRPTARPRCGIPTCASSASTTSAATAIAAFYLDPYSRPAEKRGGAWMDECLGRAPGAPSGRLPDLQPGAAGRRQAVADDASTRSTRCSTSSATACSTC